jgi:citrate synthase
MTIPVSGLRAASASGLDNVVAAETRLSHVDGEAGRLIIAGHDVEELAATHDFEGATVALWVAAGLEPVPSGEAVRAALGEARQAAFALVPGLLRLAGGAPITEGLRTGLSLLGDEAGEGRAPAHIRLLGAAAVFTAALCRAAAGEAPVAPERGAGHAEDFLRMLKGEPASAAEVAALLHGARHRRDEGGHRLRHCRCALRVEGSASWRRARPRPRHAG